MGDSRFISAEAKILRFIEPLAHSPLPKAIAKEKNAEPETEASRKGRRGSVSKERKAQAEHIKGGGIAEVLGGVAFAEMHFDLCMCHAGLSAG